MAVPINIGTSLGYRNQSSEAIYKMKKYNCKGIKGCSRGDIIQN